MTANVLVIVIGVGLIAFISWWFFAKHEQTKQTATVNDNYQEVTVEVNGGYNPETVVVKQGVPAKLIFDRKDQSGCLSEVVFADWGIDEKLPVNEKHPIEIDTSKAGEFEFACGMNMFKGKVVVQK